MKAIRDLCTKMIMEAVPSVTPILKHTIPATLKNIFDLLPVNAFRDEKVSMLVTAGSPKHYLIAEQQLKPILAYMKAQILNVHIIRKRTFTVN